MRAAIYVRQSKDTAGTHLAVDRQRDACETLITARGWQHVHTYTDNDVSASARKRPGYTAMLAATGTYDVIVAYAVDRICRRMVDLESLIERANAAGFIIVTVTGDLDLGTDTGRTVARILASVAQGEVERKSTRQKAANDQRAASGLPYLRRRGFGYDAAGLKQVAREAAAVKRMYRDFLAGKSLGGIAAQLNADGITTALGKQWTRHGVATILKNPRYCGLLVHRKEIVGPGAWAPIVDEDTWRAACHVLEDPTRRSAESTARKHLLSNLARCGRCGGMILAAKSSGNGKRSYRCHDNKDMAINADKVDDIVFGLVLARILSTFTRETLVTNLPEQFQQVARQALGHDALGGSVIERLLGPSLGSEDLAAMRERAAVLRARIAEVTSWLSETDKPVHEVLRQRDTMATELAEIEARMAAGKPSPVLAHLARAQDLPAAFQAMDLAQRREVIMTLAESVTLHSPGKGRQITKDNARRVVDIKWRD